MSETKNLDELLKDLSTQALEELVGSGEFEKRVREALDQKVNDFIDSALRPYSAFGKEVQDKLEKAFGAAAHSVSIPDVSVILQEQVTAMANEMLATGLADPISRAVKDSLAPVKEEWTTTEIVEEWISLALEWDEVQHGQEISVLVVRNLKHNWIEIGIDPEPGKSSHYTCRECLTISADDGRIFNVTLNKNNSYRKARMEYTPSSTMFLWRLFAMQVNVTMDQQIDGDYYIPEEHED